MIILIIVGIQCIYIHICIQTLEFMFFCWETRETFSSRFWSRCWVACETKFTTSTPSSVTPYLLPGAQTQSSVSGIKHWPMHGHRLASDIHVSPICSILLCSTAQDRKASSLQECVTAPTSPELVARMLALSSDRLTPAMEATSLMSSSSLSTEMQQINVCIWQAIFKPGDH